MLVTEKSELYHSEGNPKTMSYRIKAGALGVIEAGDRCFSDN